MSSRRLGRFLDTSVARPMLFGTRAYREYFHSRFGNDTLYVSNYVKMEFRRSFLVSVIDFFFILDLTTMRAIDDAFAFWSEKFKTSELKAVLQLASVMFDTERLNFSDPRDKPKALLSLGRQIKRYMYIMDGFKDTGINSPRCARANVALDVDLANLRTDLMRFLDEFRDVDTCRSKCRIDSFLLSRNRSSVEAYVGRAKKLATSKDNRGFKKIAESLEVVLKKGAQACSCKRCAMIGDAVITLDAPRNLSLEHTDSSFNHLCDIVGQPHQQHPSQVKVVQSISDNNATK